MSQQAAIDAIGPIFRSVSDRPMLVRWWISFASFMTRKPLGAFGVVLIVFVVFVALSAPLIQRYDRDRIFESVNPAYDPKLAEAAQADPMVRLQHPPEVFVKGGLIGPQAPSSEHWLGTDKYGRDFYSRIVWGSQLSLLVGIGASLIAVTFGLVFGVVSAYFGGIVDLILQRLTDAMLAFPALILLLLFVQVVENPNKYWTTLALGIVGIAQVVRIVRSAVLSARQEQYVMAAEVVGASDTRIMVRHILPNIMAPTIVIFTISIGAYILAETTLAFIGLGDPIAPSWGKMLNEGRQLVSVSGKEYLSIFPGVAIMLCVLGFNLAGDALRDVLDPRLRGRGGRAGF
jgi:ABC-type dipeptide/oligopeptide/nickel transport system permease subunit